MLDSVEGQVRSAHLAQKAARYHGREMCKVAVNETKAPPQFRKGP